MLALIPGWPRGVIALALLVSGSACVDRTPEQTAANDGSVGDYVATDDAGRTLALNAPARRVISLLPATTETVVALGGPELLVGRTDYDDPSLSALPSVGGGLTPSIEQIAALAPDLVIAWEEAGTARVRPQLEALGIPVFAAQTRDTTDIFANIDRLGSLLGLRERADSLAMAIRAEFDAVRASVADAHRPGVVYLVGTDPPIAVGPDLFIGEILEVAGGRNLFPDLPAESAPVSLEEIVFRQPDLVLLPTGPDGSDPLRSLAQRPGWSELVASSTRFETLSADTMHRPGPSIIRGVVLLRDAIHPEAVDGR